MTPAERKLVRSLVDRAARARVEETRAPKVWATMRDFKPDDREMVGRLLASCTAVPTLDVEAHVARIAAVVIEARER